MANEDVSTSSGVILSVIATLPADYLPATYQALTWTGAAVGELYEIGDITKTYEIIKKLILAARTARKAKGSYDYSDLTLQYLIVDEDTAQGTLLTYLDKDEEVAIKMGLANDNADYDTEGELYFTALVASHSQSRGSGEGNAFQSASVTLSINPESVTLVDRSDSV